jgi:hypothetical protein
MARSRLQLDYRSDDQWMAYDPDTESVQVVVRRRGDAYECAGCSTLRAAFAEIDEHVQDCPEIRR